MKTVDFILQLENEYELDDLIDEQYWTGDINSRAFTDLVLKQAAERGVVLEDADDFDFCTEWHFIMENSERGLS